MEKTYKYNQIQEWIISSINSGKYKAGQKILSEHALMTKFGVSRQTVRRATDDLAEQGVLKRVKGKGMYACSVSNTCGSTVGVLLSYFNEYIFPTVVEGIQSELKKYGYKVDLGITHNRLEEEREYLERILHEDCCGLIIEGTKSALPNPNLDLYEKLRKKGIPIVFIHNYYEGQKFPAVLVDDVEMSYQLTNKLLSAGHRKIAGVFKTEDLQSHRRYYGFIKAMMDAHLPFDVFWFSDTTVMNCFTSGLVKYLNNNDCTAMFFYNDKIAIGIIHELEKCDAGILDDLSIVAFDDLQGLYEDGLISTELTSARYPKEAIAKESVKMLFRLMEEGTEKFEGTVTEVSNGIADRSSIKRNEKVLY
ncbi:MAG: GntR family transcriptional regulator [Eubacteriales bacterium]|nr:GntR family transcriptional regulator [Eubacteriales bacterium]